MLKIPSCASLLCVLLLCSFPAHSNPISQTMQEMAGIILRLVPWAYSEETKVPPHIVEDIDRLTSLFATSSGHFNNQTFSTRMNYDLLNQQLLFLSIGARRYGGNSLRLMLTESFALCMSCHSEDSVQRNFFSEDSIKTLAPGFIKAEFLFIVRDYADAQDEYIAFLQTKSSLTHDPNRLTALERLLVLIARTSATMDTGERVLLQASNAAIDGYESRLLADWRSALSAILQGAMKPIDPLHLRIEDFAAFIEQVMPEIRATNGWQKQQVYWVVLRGYLNRFINQHKQTIEMPKLLYWLALADRSLQYKFYDTLSRLYLLECITGYPDHPYARQCFDEYELVMIVSYSGSAGLTIPAEIQEELDKLRALVYTR